MKKKKIAFSDKSIPDLDEVGEMNEARFKESNGKSRMTGGGGGGGGDGDDDTDKKKNSNNNGSSNSSGGSGSFNGDQDDDSFENEFWHSKATGAAGQATLRRRVRPYVGRQKKKDKDKEEKEKEDKDEKQAPPEN